MGTANLLARTSIGERLAQLDKRLAQLGREDLRESLAPVMLELAQAGASPEARAAVQAALGLCRNLYAQARSPEALALARAALEEARMLDDPVLMRRAATACGVISADTADLVGAIEHHVFALRLAMATNETAEVSRVWSNIGLAMGISGHYELASRCYRRSLELVENDSGPVFSRYAAYTNLADSLFQVGSSEEGLPFARKAIEELTPVFLEQDPHAAVLLERNLVRLLVATGRTEEAESHVHACAALAGRTQTPRAHIAATTARATYELALGRTDVALTLLERALSLAREVPAALRDTLACVIRAEEAAGNVGRALLRMRELSDHIYRTAIDRAREHVELGALPARTRTRVELEQDQSRARLVSMTSPAAAPESWSALDRLAVGAVMRMDETGRHGKRVGALVKSLAMASGCEPLQALEMGLAAELHDIGMMSVPEGVLKKQGPLNAAERAIVLRHVDAGSEILADDRHPRVFLAREIVRYHHARWDGDGYPERVAGKRIPLGARACAVADAYDAMVCGLGAGKSRSMNDALGELRSHAGTQFDPDLVACFDQMIRTETEDLGMDLATNSGMEGFQSLVSALQEDRGFV